MKEIDITEWKEYVLEKLFKFVNSKAYHSKDITETKDKNAGINYITRSKFNNGVKCRVIKRDDYTINPKGTISFGAENADFFYQEEEYITGNKMYYIDTQDISEKACLFIKSILEATFTKNFSFLDGMIPDRIKREKIKLPSRLNEKRIFEPDWQFMENYIKCIEQKTEEKLKQIQSVRTEKENIDCHKWKKFKINDIFHDKFFKPEVWHTRELVQDEMGIPYTVRTKFNNGIKYNVLKTEKMTSNPAGTISFGAENATFFYQPIEYVSGRDIYYIDTTHLTKNACLFLVSCLQKITDKYSYNYGMFPDLVKEEVIKLPVDDNDNPDWDYMENFIAKAEEKANNRMNYLKQIIK